MNGNESPPSNGIVVQPPSWPGLILDVVIVGAITALGLKHAIPTEAVASLLGALIGVRFSRAPSFGARILGVRRTPTIPPKE